MRGRSYSYSPSPPPTGYRRRYRCPSPGSRYGGLGRDLPTSLLVRNLHRDTRPEDLRRPFGQFGHLKDVYLPRDYYIGEPRGFGFVQYMDPDDTAVQYHADGQILLGRELTVVFAEENRKKPSEMRARERGRSPGYTILARQAMAEFIHAAQVTPLHPGDEDIIPDHTHLVREATEIGHIEITLWIQDA